MSLAAQYLHGARVSILPRDDNDFRPLALRRGPLAFLSAIMIAANVLAIGVVALTPATAQLATITSARIVQLTNEERAEVGLNSLTINSALSEAARQKGEHMLAEDYFAHVSPSGVTPWFWMQKVGYTYQVAGENLAIDFTEAEDVVAAWLASPSHKENMLFDNYLETGVAVVTGEFQGGTSTIVVHMFGLPSSGVAAATQAPEPSSEPTATPTPAPSSTPTPAATPLPDTEAPRAPRIAIVGSDVVQNTAELSADGEVDSTVYFLINSQQRASATLVEGSVQLELAIADLADGTFIIKAYSVDQAGNQSQLSDPLALRKDTTGPRLAAENVTVLIGPMSDTPQALISLSNQEAETVELSQNGETYSFTKDQPVLVPLLSGALSIALRDEIGNLGETYEVLLMPQFAHDSSQNLVPPRRLATSARNVTYAVILIVALLLSLTILIKIKIQRPALLSEASLVLVLAGLLLLI